MASIDTAFRQGYQNDFEVKFQQMGSRLRSTVTERPQNVERDMIDRIGTVNVTQRTTEHAPTVLNDADHTRIAVLINDYRPDALAFDNEDKLRMALMDPRNGYATTQAYALGQQVDRVIIAAATGTTYTGKNGTVAETYTAATYGIAVDAVAPGQVAAPSNLTIEKLIQAKAKFGTQESAMDGEQLTFVLTQSQLNSLLRTTEVTSQDYNTVRALVNGQLNTFLGFTFVRTELLSKTGDVRTCLAYPKSGIVLGMADQKTVRMDERADLNYTWQVWTQGTFGAARTWREKVVSVACNEAV
jgi:capsid protein